MTRMFKHVTKTWNPIVGCKHDCTYCWARKIAETRLRHLPQYADGFRTPKLVESAFNKKFKPRDVVFVSDMGDMWGDWVPRNWILHVINHIRKFPRATFLFLTKNPARYHEFIDILPRNVILGATIETNRDNLALEISKAPPPSKRYQAMKTLKWNHKLISIEPILDFDLDIFTNWITQIQPQTVYIGYDNHNNKLKEPPLWKTTQLITKLKQNKIHTITKTIRHAWYETTTSTLNS